MYRTGMIAGAVLLAGLLAAPLVTTAETQDQRDRERNQDRRQQQQETTQVEGLIVDLHHYLKHEDRELDEYSDADVAGQNHGGPLAIVVKDEGVVMSSTELHVICFEPAQMRDRNPMQRQRNPGNRPGDNGQDRDRDRDRDRERDGDSEMTKQVKNMVGQRVQITGVEMERDGVKAIAVKQVQRQRSNRDQDQDRQREQRERDRQRDRDRE